MLAALALGLAVGAPPLQANPALALRDPAVPWAQSDASDLSNPSDASSTPAFAGDTDISASARVDGGTLLEGTMHSDVLQMDLPYRVYLPPGYSPRDRYPTLYLLHGNGGDYSEWTEGNLVANIADAMILEGRIRPMVIAMPEGDHAYFMDWANGGPRWGQYFADEFVPWIDSRYPTAPDRGHRAVGGLSMGGVGALQLAFNHPDLFSVVGAHSPSLRLSLDNSPVEIFGDWDYYADYDPLRLALTREGVPSLRIWIDAAESDPFLEPARQLHANLSSRGIDHDWHLYPGLHFTTYWIEHSPRYLDFYSAALGE